MKAMVLLSGGVDSTVCLSLAVKKYTADNVTALCVSYGQKHIKETEAAQAIADYYKTRIIHMDLTPMFALSDCPLLKKSGVPLPTGDYSSQLSQLSPSPKCDKAPATYVPFRNGLFLSAAAAVALSLDCEVLYYGAHLDGGGDIYPDCSEAFNTAMNTAIYEGSGHKLKIEAPFVGLTKVDVVRTGKENNVPFELTWSCYEGSDQPCGVCGTCIDRDRAFAELGII